MDLDEFRRRAREGITIKRCMLCTSPAALGNELCQAHWDALLAEGDGLPCAHPGCKDNATERNRGRDFCRRHDALADLETQFCSHADCNEKAFHMVDGMDLCDDHFDQYRNPPKPEDLVGCPACKGQGKLVALGVCFTCSGSGWVEKKRMKASA